MTEQNKILINQFQETLIVPMQKALQNRQYKNWNQSEISRILEEIICSIVIEPKKNGFTLEYRCFGDKISASSDGSLSHMIHCLHELLSYLDLYRLKGGLLPIDTKLVHFEQGISELLKMINPNKKKVSMISRVI